MILADSQGVSIWRIMITVVVAPIKAILGIFPTVEIPFFSDPDTTTAGELGARMGVVNSFFPMGEAVEAAAWIVGVVLPLAATYIVANWIYRHIPTILGIGPSAG